MNVIQQAIDDVTKVVQKKKRSHEEIDSAMPMCDSISKKESNAFAEFRKMRAKNLYLLICAVITRKLLNKNYTKDGKVLNMCECIDTFHKPTHIYDCLGNKIIFFCNFETLVFFRNCIFQSN
jgi:hypothetical protein